jgi:secreted PhoX family phosphatase
MSHHDLDDIDCNPTANEHFREVLDRGLKSPARRSLLRGGVGLTAVSTLPLLSACGSSGDDGFPKLAAPLAALSFTAVGKSIADQVQVPAGYTVRVLHATGDPLVSSVAPYSNTGAETDDWANRIGDHHDGMDLFYVGSGGRYSGAATARAVLAVNHESSADAHFFHPNGQTSNGVSGKKYSQFGEWDLGSRPELEARKEFLHHGVSIVEVTLDGTGKPTGYQVDAPLNRRITTVTEVDVRGPIAHLSDIRAFMVTKFDPTGATARGTINNCGHGKTPWGTYLACEENWAVYFQIPKDGVAPGATDKLTLSRARYGVARVPLAPTATAGSGQGWHTVVSSDSNLQSQYDRWNISASGASASQDYRNEPNTFGYNLEIDPLDRNSRPAKRVAMGRFAHEAAVFSIPMAGKPLACYMGCDSRNEYIYKFVSAAVWDPADIGAGMRAGDKYLDEGKLYAAKFNSDGSGQWIELSITNPLIKNYTAYTFSNQADVFVNARHAADAVGATKMDRPEWGAVNPVNGDVYITLTNNNSSNRTPTKVDAANPRAYADADGRKGSGNPNGHIIRFAESARASDALSFKWDIFLFGSEEDAGDAINLSQLKDSNSFSSPDGLWFSPSTGICWIQTDDGAFTDETNCMLLAAIPGSVGDGGQITVQNSMVVSGATVTGTQDTFMSALLGEGRLRRFLVAPKGAEVTGITETADGKTMFVNIQHPGENTTAAQLTAGTPESTWPSNGGGIGSAYGPGNRPRSATLIITRNDGGKIGL